MKKHFPYHLMTWAGMIARCTLESSTSYKNYGGRGIKVCERWLGEAGLRNFIEDMGERPKAHTLDRIDVNGNYSPENCRWANWEQQAHNRRMQGRNKSGYKGIFVVNNKCSTTYRVTLQIANKSIISKRYKTLTEAIDARLKLEKKYIEPLYK